MASRPSSIASARCVCEALWLDLDVLRGHLWKFRSSGNREYSVGQAKAQCLCPSEVDAIRATWVAQVFRAPCGRGVVLFKFPEGDHLVALIV